MTILRQTTLSEEQTSQVRALELCCNQHDNAASKLFLYSHFNFDQSMNCFYLLYEEGRLISFLTLFCPSKKEVELSGFTLPSHRRKGYFNRLFTLAKEEITKFGVDEILFVHNPKAEDAKPILKKLNAVYDFSEYIMSYSGDVVEYQSDRLALVPVTEIADKEEIALLFTSAFNEESELDAGHWFDCNFETATSTMYKAVVDEKMVGILCVDYKEEPVSIFGLCIRKEEQAKGYGKAMLLSVLSLLTKAGHGIRLDVNSVNDVAFAMYQKYGFTINSQGDYYRYQL